jgi:hypothetical protein
LGGAVVEGGGLIDDFDRLSGEGFDPARLAPAIVDFYERTSEWRLEVWSQWSSVAWPFGWMLSTVFARRLRQLSLSLRPLDVARGMESRVVAVIAPDGAQLGADEAMGKCRSRLHPSARRRMILWRMVLP